MANEQQSTGHQEALRRIENAQRVGAESLELRGLGLLRVPPEIGTLHTLQYLNLYFNKLRELPPEIGALNALKSLDLAYNEITVLPPEIGSLKVLKTLDLHKNHLTTLPPEIGSLNALEVLALSNNHLSVLPPEIGSLKALKVLYLHNNLLSALPPEIRELTSLEAMFVHENPHLELPREILGPEASSVLMVNANPKPPQEIFDYYFRIAAAGESLQECKLIVVGRGGAGKTSLIRRLNGEPLNLQESETHGITIKRLAFPCKGGAVKARVWDFGGQVVLHSMHEFFLTARSLYLLVLGERDDMLERDADYWLQLIRSYAGNVPVVVALNKSQGKQRQFDRATLEANYPPILGWIPTECTDSPEGIASIESLRAALTQALESSHMDSVRRKFPRQWSSIKSRLDEMSESYLDYAKYQEICTSLHETNSQAQDNLSGDLHDLGIALNYRRDPRLRETSVLRPDWLANGIYAVLRSNDLDAKLPTELNRKLAPDGRVTLVGLEQIYAKAAAWKMLQAADYPADKRRFLLRLMDAFQLSYPLDDDGEVHLVPTLLELNPPQGAEEPTDPGAVRLRYEFQVVPAPLLPWFIARTFALIPDSLHWRRGTILVFGDARARVWTTQDERYVFVTVVGGAEDREQLVMMIRGTLKLLFDRYRGLRVVEQHDFNGSWVPRAALEKLGLISPDPQRESDLLDNGIDIAAEERP